MSEEKMGFFARLKQGLTKTRDNFVSGIDSVFNGFSNIDEEFYEELEEILRKEINEVDKAIELLLYTMKKQIFIDGNKRTSVIFINHYLISKGKGIIAIPAELTEEFKDLLISYYEGKDTNKIKRFIKEKCYMGI